MEFNFLIALIALAIGWGATIGIKVVIETIKNKQFDFYYLVTDGGFPSSHSALVAALVTISFFFSGFSLTTFITFFIAFLIIRDALGVRQEVGKQKIILERLSPNLAHSLKLRREGHNIWQVLFGVLFGVVVTLLVLVLIGGL